MKRIRFAGISHRTAAVEVRERLVVPRHRLVDALAAAREATGCEEAVLLSTCNRVELYVAGEEPCDPTLGLIAAAKAALDREDAGEVAEEHVDHRVGADAVQHLFRVATSLDSMVPGEAQILGQVRHAYEAARVAGHAGRRLHGLFQRAIRVGRDVRVTAGLGQARIGVAETAAEYAEEVLGPLGGKRVLCVGTGKMTSLVLRHLHGRPPSHRPSSLMVVGRDADRASLFADGFGGSGGALADLEQHLADADLLVCGTGHQGHVVRRDLVDRVAAARGGRPLFAIDLAVPRDIEPSCGSIAGVHLYDLDDLQQAASSRTTNGSELAKAEAMVDASVQQYVAWHRARTLGPTIDRLYGRSHESASSEVERFAAKLPGNLTAEQREAVERQAADLARRLVNKLLHGPVSAMRQVPDAERHAAYRHAVEKLFSLEDVKPKPDLKAATPGT